MRSEMKLCLPVYKLLYSALFIVILSLIRGVAYIREIGLAMEPPVALLTAVFCADTYLIEVQRNRREIFKIKEPKRQIKVIFRRLLIQMSYLFGITLLGYGMFFWQRPIDMMESVTPMEMFILFVIAIAGTILFWGALSLTLCNILRNVWIGLGSTLAVWIILDSQAGARFLGKWSVFSYTFRPLEKGGDFSWMWGKGISVILAIMMLSMVPFLLKKRG